MSASSAKPRVGGRPQAGRGRPRLSVETMNQIAIRLPAELLESVDAIIAERHGQAGRTQVIRELIAEALEFRAKRKGK